MTGDLLQVYIYIYISIHIHNYNVCIIYMIVGMKKCECIYYTVKMLWYAVLCYGPMHSCSHALLSRIQPGI